MKSAKKAKNGRRAIPKACLKRVQLEVADAARLAKSMKRQLKAGDVELAFQTALDIEPHLHHGNDVIQAASLFAKPIGGS